MNFIKTKKKLYVLFALFMIAFLVTKVSASDWTVSPDWVGDLSPFIVAAFTFSPDQPQANNFIIFDASYSLSSSTIANYTWSFGDGNITVTSLAIIEHIYTANNSYLVGLTVGNDVGNYTITIPVAVGGLFTGFTYARFVYSPSNPMPNATIVNFDATPSQTSGTILGYTWDFGDNTTDTGVNVTHVYQVEGNFSVTLEVTSTESIASQVQVVDVVDWVSSDNTVAYVLFVGIVCSIVAVALGLVLKKNQQENY
jgi:PKD repeat protein